jgi:hypothetical protein
MSYATRTEVIFDAITADATSEPFGGGRTGKDENSKHCLKASGGFGGGELTLEADFDSDEAWAPLVDPSTGSAYSFTSAFCVELSTKAGIRLRGKLTGATASTLTLKRIR